MSEELGLEDTVDQGIWFLSADYQREPIILQIGGADALNGPNRNSAFGRNDELVVLDALHHDVHTSVGLFRC